MIPPPIVQSTYALPSRSTVSPSVLLSPRAEPTDDRDVQLQADLQYLLDAQAEGLLRGLAASPHENGASTGSTTPTAKSARSASRRPVRRMPGLRSARKGLYGTMLALANVKVDELHGIDEELQTNAKDSAQLEQWEQKRHGLQAATAEAGASADTTRVQRLRDEADKLQSGIRDVELQLADMRSRHRKLIRRMEEAENEVQAKMSSYRQSMELLENDVQQFLARKPTAVVSRPGSRDGQASVWELPTKRRTLELAKEQLHADREAQELERRRVQRERQALEDGAALWKEVAATVTALEKRIRGDMSSSLDDPDRAWDEAPDAAPTAKMRDLLQAVDGATVSLQTRLEDAEVKNWRLLVVAIGAELEALRQGRTILSQALGEAKDPRPDPESPNSPIQQLKEDSGDDKILELDKSFETARKQSLSNGETDDEIDPELLFSQQDSPVD
ncbi:hypothetical protein B0A48_06504 [Cryoendolithus antarcticus]|uniref:Uncharacterized protein n=1 Tax=Cryoendolithus antarcticus TaxID=1507870 RepID=A0A1V8TBG9_9PEZI|nr:hypothetical protein B0A48_06504 [Cryoendolithus antarcticus]